MFAEISSLPLLPVYITYCARTTCKDYVNFTSFLAGSFLSFVTDNSTVPSCLSS